MKDQAEKFPTTNLDKEHRWQQEDRGFPIEDGKYEYYMKSYRSLLEQENQSKREQEQCRKILREDQTTNDSIVPGHGNQYPRC